MLSSVSSVSLFGILFGMRFVRCVALAEAAALALWGHFGMPSNAPVERLLTNVAAYVKSHPTDANGYYVLGRLHYLAFAQNTRTLYYWPSTEPGELIAPRDNVLPGRAMPDGRYTQGLTEKDKGTHVTEALRLLQKAVAMQPQNGLYELGLACVFEDGAISANAAEWREEAIRHYLAAFRLAIDRDERQQTKPLHGIHALVSYEAGDSYLRLVRQRGIRVVAPQIVDTPREPELESATVRLVEKKIAKLERLPMGPITPIVLTLRSGATLKDLLAPATRVTFDLDGTGRPQSYSWLQPDAAFLVWDPEHTGGVTSGRQLFGTVTWWMFWDSGYQALAALDDDGDGWLSGGELAGLALWFDKNQNGITEPGEVIPIEQAGVEALAVRADGTEGVSPMSAHGVRFKDGRVLPTWDWVTSAQSATTPLLYGHGSESHG